MDLNKCAETYRKDPAFHAAVDAMRSWILETRVTPAEVRAAAMYACYLVECETIRPMFTEPTGEANAAE